MSRVINATQIAVLYETITGQCQKRGVITTDTSTDIDAELARHPGLAAIIISKSLLPGPNQNEAFFRQQIATATGTSVFAAGADRAVQVSNAGNIVVSVHYGNVPGLDRADAGRQLISHRVADLGDTFAAGVFSRRYVVISTTLGTVLSTAVLPLGTAPTLLAGQTYLASQSLTIGQTVALKSPSV